MKKWHDCKNILCIRTDNMGDLLMSIPALRALKETFGCKITLLTSPVAEEVAKFIPEVDEWIAYNSPWNRSEAIAEDTFDLISLLQSSQFDACVIFTVYSQNPLPAAMLAFMAGIPRRLAYCRETPYGLLTHWIPEKEPYSFIQHQVKRDLRLVKSVGAETSDDRLLLCLSKKTWISVKKKLSLAGVNLNNRWIIMHAGVSEEKRAYPSNDWVVAGKKILEQYQMKLLFTGTPSEKKMINTICVQIGPGAFNLSGHFELEEFITLISHAPLVISVNTATIHLAAAVNTPVIVLYALTNPQHTPWRARGKILPYHPPEKLRSQNEVVRDAYNHFLKDIPSRASPRDIVEAVDEILHSKSQMFFPATIQLKN